MTHKVINIINQTLTLFSKITLTDSKNLAVCQAKNEQSQFLKRARAALGILKIFFDPVNKQKVRDTDILESPTMNPSLSRETSIP